MRPRPAAGHPTRRPTWRPTRLPTRLPTWRPTRRAANTLALTLALTLACALGVAPGPAWADPPAAPDAPVATAADAQITVAFDPPADDGGSPITGYEAACTSSDGGAPGNQAGATSPITVTGLTNGKTYTCTVAATNGDGTGPASPASNPAVPSTTPAAPAAPTATAANAQITVAFVAPADGGSAITGYTAACTSSNGGAPGNQAGATSPITVTGLTNGKTYTCTVTAANANGTGPASPASNPAVPSTTPAAPNPPAVTATNAQITVAFVAPADGGSAITGYTAACTSSDGGAPGNQTGATSPITVISLTNGKTYTCTVTAANANGTGPASAASEAIVPSTVPAAPAAPTVTVGDAQLAVAFVPPADGGRPITGYDVACSSSNGGVFGSETGTTSPIVVTGLTNGRIYTCTVAAANANGAGSASPASNPAVPSTVPGTPPAPALVAGDAQIFATFGAPDGGGSAITGYTLDCTSSDGGAPGSETGTTSPIVVTGLTNGKTYTCTVAAANANGTGPASPASNPAVPSTIPGRPARPTVTPGDARMTVAFTSPADGGSPITSYRATCSSTLGAGTKTGNKSPITVAGLVNGTGYTCTVSATNARGTGPVSKASAAAVPSTVPAAPPRPGVKPGDASIKVSFTAPDSGGRPITGYTARCRSSDGGTTRKADGTKSPITVARLTNGRKYTCQVRATNANGSGPYSTASKVVVPAPAARGFRLVSGDGGVFVFGSAKWYGSAAGVATARVIGIASTPDNRGYWLAAADGSVYAFGNASSYGSARGFVRNAIVGITATPSGKGYWLVGSDGGIFAFGDARFFGSTGALRLLQPIVGMAATPTGAGYWLVAGDGGMFAFGDARFFGAARSGEQVVGMAPSATGQGYWVVTASGTVSAFGDAPRLGSVKAGSLRLPVRGIATTPSGRGYWVAAGDGGVFAFGDAPYYPWPGPVYLAQTIRAVSR